MKYLVSIAGPTASGKTDCALYLANEFGCPVISADSVQIYRGLDIGSGKVTPEERGRIPHYMIDVIDPDQVFSAGKFEREVDDLLVKLFRENDVVILAGGTGFYFQAVWEGFDEIPDVPKEVREKLNAELEKEGLPALVTRLKQADPETCKEIDLQNPSRVVRAMEVFEFTGKPISFFRKNKKKKVKDYSDIRIGLDIQRDLLYERINLRVDKMMELGFLEEVSGLIRNFGKDAKALGSVGYAELKSFLSGECSLEEAVGLIKMNTRRYAKRQMTWFRKSPEIHWMIWNDPGSIHQYILQQMNAGQSS